jgi:hypothetical protein
VCVGAAEAGIRGAKGLFELKRLLGGWICDIGRLGAGSFGGDSFEDGGKPKPGFDFVDELDPERA